MIIATCCAVLMFGTATTAELPPRRPPAPARRVGGARRTLDAFLKPRR